MLISVLLLKVGVVYLQLDAMMSSFHSRVKQLLFDLEMDLKRRLRCAFLQIRTETSSYMNNS